MVVDAEVWPSAGAPRLALSTGLVRLSFRKFGETRPGLGASAVPLGASTTPGQLRD